MSPSPVTLVPRSSPSAGPPDPLDSPCLFVSFDFSFIGVRVRGRVSWILLLQCGISGTDEERKR